MKLFQRFAYYGIGLIIGGVFVYFIWEKKNVEFNYGPNARVLDNIRKKKTNFTPTFLAQLQENSLDTSIVRKILKNGNVDISGKTKIDCGGYQYTIEGKKELNLVSIVVSNCDSIAEFNKVIMKDSQ